MLSKLFVYVNRVSACLFYGTAKISKSQTDASH